MHYVQGEAVARMRTTKATPAKSGTEVALAAALRSQTDARGDKSPRAVGSLPIKLQRKLSLPSVADGVVDRSKRVARGIIQEIRVANTCPKVGVIQEVEELSPEFQVGVFSRSEFLEDREIKVGESRPVHLVPSTSERAEISLPNGGHGRRLNEG